MLKQKGYHFTEYSNYTEVLLPILSPAMELDTIVSWLKNKILFSQNYEDLVELM